MLLNKTYVYCCQLTEDSIKALKEKIPPKHAKVFYHHVTLAFNPSREIFEKYEDLIGKEIELQVFGYCHDDRGQAVLVDLIVPVEKEIPHITLSCNQETKPFYSESLVQKKTNYGNVYLEAESCRLLKRLKNDILFQYGSDSANPKKNHCLPSFSQF